MTRSEKIIEAIDTADLRSVIDSAPCVQDLDLDLEEWLADKDSLALEKDGSYALFQCIYPGVWYGHYFFRARGKQAIELANEFIDTVFREHDFRCIVGLTPSAHKAALWMNRRLGFTDYGEIPTATGPNHLVLLTREDWKR